MSISHHEKSPAQGGEMPPVERAAITGSGGIDTVRGAEPADNAAQERAIPWAHTRSGAVRRGTDASKMARRDYGLTDNDSERHDFEAGFSYGTKYGHLSSTRAAGVPAAMITSLECAAQSLEHGKDPKAAAAEIRACLAKLDAAPAAPVADVAPNVIEAIAEQWDGCMYAAPGIDIDVGEAIRQAATRFAAKQRRSPATAAAQEHYDEIKATLTGAHRLMESLSAIERHVGSLGSHARGYTHKITAALRHLDALVAPAEAREPVATFDDGLKVYLNSWTGGRHEAGSFGEITLRFTDERHTNVRDYRAKDMAPVDAREQFQARVQLWMMECFGPTIAADRVERNHRFLEEALELVQSLGCAASEAHQLVDYIFGRPIGEPAQEVGGVMVTLAALCLASSLDMHHAGETELARISEPATVLKIRAKQAAKPKHSPLPQAAAARAPYEWRDTGPLETDEGGEA
ncbi:hypothetical protein [Burkholderia gladioli]|uniref:hypothetical protein n=1 Tax=Burkholderia gladioli TaxID=28095 RepID=UPI001ABB9CC5|nr:hypothetical protein [Burkholderia gladioli]